MAVQNAVEDRPVPPSLVASAVQSQALVLLWKLQIHMAEEESARDLTDLLRTTTEQLNALILLDEFELKTMCIRVLSDLYQIFSSPSVKVGASLVCQFCLPVSI